MQSLDGLIGARVARPADVARDCLAVVVREGFTSGEVDDQGAGSIGVFIVPGRRT